MLEKEKRFDIELSYHESDDYRRTERDNVFSLENIPGSVAFPLMKIFFNYGKEINFIHIREREPETFFSEYLKKEGLTDCEGGKL